MYDVSILADCGADKTRVVGGDDPTRGSLLWAIASGRIPRTVAARIGWDGGCWTFEGCTDKDGYGSACVGGRTHRVHRLVYEAVFGAIPDGYDLHHEVCERKDCCDPRHVVAIPHDKHSRLTRRTARARLSAGAA